MGYSITAPLNQNQLDASSTAAGKYGVPVYLLRGVANYKYGPRNNQRTYNYVAGQLSNWYAHFYQQNHNALSAWQHAAAQEMPGASREQVAVASSYQTAAQGGMLTAPIFGLGGLIGILRGIGGSVGGADVAAGVSGAGAAGEAGGAAVATDTGASGAAAGSGAAGSAGAAGGTSLFDRVAGAITGPVAFLGWIAWIFHPLNILRAVEFLVGIATIGLGVHMAMTGQHQTNSLRRIIRATPIGHKLVRRDSSRRTNTSSSAYQTEPGIEQSEGF